MFQSNCLISDIMADVAKMKSLACESIDRASAELNEVSQSLWKNPELGYEEKHAHTVLTDSLKVMKDSWLNSSQIYFVYLLDLVSIIIITGYFMTIFFGVRHLAHHIIFISF